MPTVTLTAGPPHGGYVVDPVTRTRWLIGESHVIEDPAIEERLAGMPSRGYFFAFTTAVDPAPAAPVAPVAPAPVAETPIPPAAPAAS